MRRLRGSIWALGWCFSLLGLSCQFRVGSFAPDSPATPAVSVEEDLKMTARACQGGGEAYKPRVRHYYLAAEDVRWDYAPSGKNMFKEEMGMGVWGRVRVYPKTRYIEYTDDTFSMIVPQPLHLGILGPTIRAVVGDTLKVHFLNRGKQPYSVHPHGVFYTKDNDGAAYAGIPGKGHAVEPGQRYTYTWEVPPRAGPARADGSSVVWAYHSHVNAEADMYAGLFGAIVITSADKTCDDARPTDVDREFVAVYFIINENTMLEGKEANLKHAINGYIFSNLPGLTMKKGERVRWYLIGLGTEVDLHTPHWHGESVVHLGRRTDVVELLPASMHTTDMIAANVGTWSFHCHVGDHMMAGMNALYTIREK